jgi:hypothetical protein
MTTDTVAPFSREAPPVLNDQRRHPSDLVRVRMTFGGESGRGLPDGSFLYHGDVVTLPPDLARGMTSGFSPIAIVLGYVPAPPPPPDDPVSILDRLRSAFGDPDIAATPQHATDLVKVRMRIDGGAGVSTADGQVVFDGDEVLVTQEEVRAYPKASMSPYVVLGYVPLPPSPPVVGPSLTVRFTAGRLRLPPSEHLGRAPHPDEVATLPADEARQYVSAGLATLNVRSLRQEFASALLALASLPTPDAATRARVALDDVLRAYGVSIPAE